MLTPACSSMRSVLTRPERIEADIRSALPDTRVFTHLESLEDPASWDDVELDRSTTAPPETQSHENQPPGLV